MSCPPIEALLAWRSHLGADDPTSAPTSAQADVAAAAHLHEGCPSCRRRVQLLDRLIAAMAQPAPPAVPSALRQRVLSELKALDLKTLGQLSEQEAPGQPSTLGRLVGRLQEFVAELIEPLASPALAAGLRGEDDTDLRRYRAGGFTLDVGLVERRAVLGQLLDSDGLDAELFEGAAAVLCSQDGAQEVSLDEDGAFRFNSTGPGRFALLIESDDLRLVFPDIDLTVAGD
ncbi:MAG: hypothetical protein ACI9EF_003278 [Pseudohongiellaceae bacterium]|jgi:hypothetical protein